VQDRVGKLVQSQFPEWPDDGPCRTHPEFTPGATQARPYGAKTPSGSPGAQRAQDGSPGCKPGGRRCQILDGVPAFDGKHWETNPGHAAGSQFPQWPHRSASATTRPPSPSPTSSPASAGPSGAATRPSRSGPHRCPRHHQEQPEAATTAARPARNSHLRTLREHNPPTDA
jgi:hypothetical protein